MREEKDPRDTVALAIFALFFLVPTAFDSPHDEWRKKFYEDDIEVQLDWFEIGQKNENPESSLFLSLVLAKSRRWNAELTGNLQTRPPSTVTRVTGSIVSVLAGESPRVSMDVSADVSGALSACPRCVFAHEAGEEQEQSLSLPFEDFQFKGKKALTLDTMIDRLWLQQEDPFLDSLRPQGFPRPQRQGP